LALFRFSSGILLSLSLSLSGSLFFLISLIATPVRVQAFHIATTTPGTSQTTSAQSGTGQTTKPGTTLTQSSASGLDASVTGFNIQTFHADLFSGSAGAEIPIIVPPGAAGVAPKIGLNYSSSLVDDMGVDGKFDQADWVGLGWNLEAGGFVLRDTKGTISTSDDKFKLIFNGATHELISIGSGNYRTKDEQFWLINFNSSNDIWTLRTKDGALHKFGSTSNSRATGLTFGPNKEAQVTFRYYIDEAVTTSGVQVKYNYFKQSSSYNKKTYDQAVYIDTITYAYRNNSLLGPAREVRFIRGSRTDWKDVSPQWHASYHQLSRLDAIEIKVGTSLVRRYNFGYDYSIDRDLNETWQGGATGDLTLKSITLVGHDGTTALPDLTFNYTGALLGTVNNSLGGSKTFLYEGFDGMTKNYTEEEQCWYAGMSHQPVTYGCVQQPVIPFGIVLTESQPNTIPIYRPYYESEFNSCDNGAGELITALTGEECKSEVFGYLYTSQVFDSHPMYRQRDENDDPQTGFCGFTEYALTQTNDECPDIVIGYLRPGQVDGPRHRVSSITTTDGRGWSSTTNFVYYDPAMIEDQTIALSFKFIGHGKVRTIDPLGNYTDTWFFQDEIKKGRAYRVEVRNAAGALFNKTENTFTTSNPIAGNNDITFVALTRSDYFECEAQATCHQNAETFTFDNNGNPTQKNDLGDVGTTGDERTEVTEWVVDATNWIHRPKRVALLDSAGATVRERWMYYDNAAHGVLGTRGLVTKEESRLTGNIGDAGNPTVTYGYDIYGNRNSVTDARGCATTTLFESSQTYPSTVTNCLNHTGTMVYDHRFGAITSQTDANNQTTTTAYDPFGRPTKVTGPLDGTSQYGTVSTLYLDWGNPNLQRVTTYRTEQHGTANVIWSEEYFDGLGRIYKSQKEGPGGQTIISDRLFDIRGLVWKTSAPHFTSETTVFTEFLYDALGRPSRTNFADGTSSQTLYEQHEVTAIDPRGKIKRTHTDSHHRVSEVEEVDGSTSYFTTYQYDAADKLVKVTNALGHNTHNVYDLLGRKIAMCDPNMGASSSLSNCTTTTPGAWVYTYNKAGDLLTQKDSKGQTITFEYDLIGRQTFKKQGATILVEFTYDTTQISPSPTGGDFPVGRLTKVNQPQTNIITKFAYDKIGRTLQSQRTLLGVPHDLYQSYDALNRIITETFPDKEQVTYNYNAAGWLQSVTATSGPNYVNDIQYNARGQRKTITYGNNLVTTFTYNDPVDRPSAPADFRVFNRTTSSNQQNLTYGYDANGNVTSIVDALFTATRTFTYDDLNRLETATGTFGSGQAQQNCTGANRYIYNAIGNLTGKCGYTLEYNDAAHPSAVTALKLGTTTIKSYTYDANGNMQTRGNQTLVWDLDNRVSSISITGGGTTSMEYDYAGFRVKKNAPTGLTLYPFEGYEIAPDGTITKFIRVGGEALASKKGADKYFYHNDHLGSVNVITDWAGVRVQLNEYGPWGEVSRSEVSTPPVDPDQRFTGQKLDPETGLYYYGGRYYDAEIGRFISPDPFVQTPFDPQNLNRYTYVLNNPQNYIDPSGYFHKVKKPSLFQRFLGSFLGGIMLLLTGDPILAYLTKSVVDGGVNGGAAGAVMGFFTAGAYLIGGPFGGAVFSGIVSEMNGGNFGNGFGNALLNSFLTGGFNDQLTFSSSTASSKNLESASNWSDFSALGGYEIRTVGHDDAGGRRFHPRYPVPNSYLPFTKDSYRHNLAVRTGVDPGLSMQAHHIFPQRFRVEFATRFGINIDDPKYLTWWSTELHLHNSAAINRVVERFLNTPGVTRADALFLGRQMGVTFGFAVGY
jgi:RHS repeat-associated protein